MNKIKELWKKHRLTSWHIYGVVLLYVLADVAIDGYSMGYDGYLAGRTAVTLEQFESILAWLAISSVLIMADLVASVYLWYKESQDADSNDKK